ncbi:MAG TPA: DMT family transporter [Acidobacteriota bacterium]|nr:DMT family transporter [Acidobacteriota bacterium]
MLWLRGQITIPRFAFAGRGAYLGRMPYLGELAALGTAFCWSFTAVFFSEAGRRIGSFRVNSIRLLFAVTIYCIVLLVTTGRIFPEDLNSSQVFWLALSGFIGLVLGDGCGFKALVMIGPRLTTLLWSTAPIMATVIAWFLLGEQLGLLHLVGIGITIAGLSWVVLERRYGGSNQFNLHREHPDSGTLLKGVLLGLAAALGQAAGLVLSKHAMLNAGGILDPMPASFIRMLSSLIVIWLFAGLSGRLRANVSAFKNGRAVLFAAGGATMGPFLGVWLSLVAVTMIPAGIAATLNAATPILIIPVVIAYYREKVTFRALIGALLAVGGMVLLFFADELSGLF